MNPTINQIITANPLSDIMAQELAGHYPSLVIVAVNHEGQVTSYIRRTGDQWDLLAASALECARMALLDRPAIRQIIER